MRTTIRLNEKLLREAKEFAARHGTSLTRLVEDALFEKLRQPNSPRQDIDLPVDGHGGLCEGVNLDSNSDLLAFMESAD